MSLKLLFDLLKEESFEMNGKPNKSHGCNFKIRVNVCFIILLKSPLALNPKMMKNSTACPSTCFRLFYSSTGLFISFLFVTLNILEHSKCRFGK
jgi:hypothetical protein